MTLDHVSAPMSHESLLSAKGLAPIASDVYRHAEGVAFVYSAKRAEKLVAIGQVCPVFGARQLPGPEAVQAHIVSCLRAPTMVHLFEN